LKPKKAKEFIPDVADKLALSKELVEDVIDYYWREVRKSITTVTHSRIHLTNLGDFVIKEWKLNGKIEGLEKWEETNRQKGLQQMTARFKTAETIYQLKEVRKIVNEEQQRKEFIKLHKKSNNVTRS